MENSVIHINPEDIEIVDSADYCDDVYDCYVILPEVENQERWGINGKFGRSTNQENRIYH